jgi:beta-galactosidase
MKKDSHIITFGIGLLLACQLVVDCPAADEQPLTDAGKPGRTEVGFNADWRFLKGSPAGAEATAFDDAKWERVRLPHDWAIFGPFIQELNGGSGKVQWQGIAWYRKHFRLPATTKGKRIFLDFDGVLAAPKVYVNGKLAGQCDYGYMSFRVDATPYLNWSGENVVAVSADTTAHGTRWYPGAGIYRKVMLVICEPVHVAQWGTQITTPVIKGKEAEVRIRTTVISKLPRTKAKVALESVVFNPEGAEVGRVKTEAQLQGGYYRVYDQSLTLREIQLWDVESPKLYKVRSLVWVEDKLMDSYESPFGIRSIEWTAEDGFHLNGRRVQLNGVNLHHDQGPLGAAFYRRAMERQLELLKEAGVNAVRTSHNVQSPELLELCDQLGILVYNEAFDKWNGLTDRDFVMKTLLDFVRRDRNHPSAICWSIGNEIPPIEANDVGNAPETVKLFTDAVRLLDPTRPVTLGAFVSHGLDKGIQEHLDFNDMHYGGHYADAKKLFPKRPTVYSESASALSTRGFYKLPLPTKKTDFAIPELQIDSYDLNAAPWADIPDVEFERMRNDRYCAGEFVWTGFDYLGEPTPYDAGMVKSGAITMAQTARSSYFGFVDLVGIPKDRYYLYRSHWAPKKTTVHLVPHWNWPDRVGKPVPVFLYTNGDEAELFLNGKSLGRRKKAQELPRLDLDPYYAVIDKYRLRWMDVSYQPGELKAVAYKDGKKIGEDSVRTAGAPAKLRLTPDRFLIAASGQDLSYVLVEAVDKDGVLCPLANDSVQFTLTGPGEIAGVGNGNPQSLDPFQANHVKLFYGKAMLIVRSVPNQIGSVQVTATSKGLGDAKVQMETTLTKTEIHL